VTHATASAADDLSPSRNGRAHRILIDPPPSPQQIAKRQRRGLPVEPRGMLVDAETGEVCIMAAMAYIDAKVAERGLHVIERRQLTRSPS
jgi:hypothetical protein